MNKAVAFAFLAFLIAFEIPAAQNIIKNGRFERYHRQKPDYWYIKGDVLREESSGFPKSKYCMILKSKRKERSGRSVAKEAREKTNVYLGQSFDFESGNTYEISFYARSVHPNQTIALVLAGRKKGEKPVFKSRNFNLSENWKKFSFSYNFSPDVWTGRKCNINFCLSYGSAYMASLEAVKSEKTLEKKQPSGLSWSDKRTNILLNPGFELKWQDWSPGMGLNNPKSEPVEFDSKIKQSGLYSMKLPPYSSAVSLRYNFDPEETYTISFYARSDDNALRSRSNATKLSVLHPSWKNKTIAINSLTNEWKRYHITFKGKDMIGVPKQMKVCPPYERNSFYIKIKSGNQYVWVDSFQLEKGELTKYTPGIDIGFQSDIKNSIFIAGKTGEVEALVFHAGGIKEKMELSCVASDIYGKVIWEEKFKLKPTEGNLSVFKKNFKNKQLGVVGIKSLLKDKSGKIISRGEWRYLVIDNFDKFKNPMLGCQNDGLIQWPLWVIRKRADIIDLLGISFTKVALFRMKRTDDYKSLYEPIRKICEVHKKHGLEVMAHVDFPKGHPMSAHSYVEQSPEDKEKSYEFFAEKFVAFSNEFKDCIDKLYIMGEPNLYRTKTGKAVMPPERAAKIYKAVKDRVAREDRDIFIGGSMNGTDFNYLHGLFKNGAGQNIKKMNFHSYRATPEAPYLYDDLTRLGNFVKKYEPNLDLINGEQYYGIRHYYCSWGEFGAHYYADTEFDLAGRVVQNWLHHLAAGIPMCFFQSKAWLFKLGGVNPIFYYYTFGGLRNASKLLNNVKSAGHIAAHKSLRAFIFEKQGSKVVSINTRELERKGVVKKPELCLKAFDFNGNEINDEAVSLSWLPSYFMFKAKTSNKEIEDALKGADYKGLSVPIEICFSLLEDKNKMELEFVNCSSKPVDGVFRFTSFPKGCNFPNEINFKLEGDKTKKMTFDFPKVNLMWNKQLRIDYSLECEGVIENFSFRLPSIFAGKAQSVKVDGKLDDWENSAWMTLGKEQMNISPPRKNAPKQIYEGAEDFSGDIALAWDDKFVYVAVKVKDGNADFGDGFLGKFYMSDSLQIYFDQKNNAKKKKIYDGDDVVYQIGLDKKGEPVAWLEKNPTGRYVGEANLTTGIDGDVQTAFQKLDDGYIFEMAFPKAALPFLELKPGSIFGFSMFVHDKDGNDRMKSFTFGVPQETNYRNPFVWRAVKLKN